MAAETLADDEDVLVVIVRGANAPGVTSTLVALVEQSGDQVFILDIAQYILEGSLVLTIMLRFEDASPVKLMRDMLDASRRLGMQAQFHFPAPGARRESSASTVMSITVAVPDALPLDLVHGILAYVSATAGQVLELGHQLEDTVEFGGSLACVRLRVSYSADVLVSKLYLDMQKLCRRHSAEVAVRECDSLQRPNGKSLIVFGLSEVLCPYDIVDELLNEAGVDPKGAEQAAAKTHETTAAAKLKLLKGKPAECQARLVARLEFTPGAREVCRFLKELGFRLALLSLSGGDVVSKAVKQELNLDYAISPSFGVDEAGNFTGQYTGWNADMQLRKADYLQLMAEKEHIDLRNVIVVGSFMRGLPKETVHNILDTYGPTLYFNAPKMPDLTVILHLLGFTGKDLQSLPISSRGTEAAAGPKAGAAQSEDTCRCLLRVHSKESDAGKFAKLLEPLARYQQSGSASVLSMEQATIASGDAFLGLQLVLGQSETEAVLKDLLFEGRRVGLDMDWDLQKGLPGKEASCKDVSKSGQYVITLVQMPELQVSCLCAVFQQCSDLGVDLIRLDRLSRSRLSALQITASVPDGIEAALRSGLLATSKAFDVDIAFQRDGIERWGRRLIIFDMDSTLIEGEVIDELAKLAGVESVVGEITARAMRGEMDFHQSLRERVALLKGHNAKKLFDAVKKDLVYTPGAERLCRTLKQLGYKMAVISGGFIPMAREVQSKLGLDYAFANTLQVDQNGNLTGETIGPVVTPERKRALLSMIAEVEGCDVRQTIAVGDGSNDIPMLCAAGLGVAFCAKPKVQAVAEFRVNNKDLSTVLFLIGLSESATHSLDLAGADSYEADRVPRSWP